MVVISNNVIYYDNAEAEKAGATVSQSGEFSFGLAFAALMQGYKIGRTSWNGPNQYVTRILPGNAMHQGFPMQPCLGLRNSRFEMQPGWVPSQGDLFATDWYVIYEGGTLL